MARVSLLPRVHRARRTNCLQNAADAALGARPLCTTATSTSVHTEPWPSRQGSTLQLHRRLQQWHWCFWHHRCCGHRPRSAGRWRCSSMEASARIARLGRHHATHARTCVPAQDGTFQRRQPVGLPSPSPACLRLTPSRQRSVGGVGRLTVLVVAWQQATGAALTRAKHESASGKRTLKRSAPDTQGGPPPPSIFRGRPPFLICVVLRRANR